MKYKVGPKGPTIIDERSKGKAATRQFIDGLDRYPLLWLRFDYPGGCAHLASWWHDANHRRFNMVDMLAALTLEPS